MTNDELNDPTATTRCPRDRRDDRRAVRHSSFVIRHFAAALLAAALAGCEAFEVMPAASTPSARGMQDLESLNADARREAALALSRQRLADDGTRATVVRKLAVMAQSDPDALVRSAALQGLLAQDPATALDVARRVRADESEMVRLDALKIIIRRGGKRHVPVLIEMLTEDPDANVRREAARALIRYDEMRVVRALVAALDDGDLSVVQASHASLVKLSAGVDFGMKRAPWETWWK